MLFFRIGEGERCYDAASLRQAFSRTLGALGSHNGLFELECLKNAPSFAPIASSVRTITKKMTVGEASAFGLYAYGDDSVKEVLSKDPQVIYAEDYADGRDIPGHAVALSRMGLRDGDISDVAYELSYHTVENVEQKTWDAIPETSLYQKLIGRVKRSLDPIVCIIKSKNAGEECPRLKEKCNEYSHEFRKNIQKLLYHLSYLL